MSEKIGRMSRLKSIFRLAGDAAAAAGAAAGAGAAGTGAAPGFWSAPSRTALAAAMNNQGRLVACDRDGRRLLEFKQRARRDGVHNYELRTVPEGPSGDERIRDLLGAADAVLVDAPCSGLGALRRNPDARWRLTQVEVDSFPPRQREILERYAALVKPGGRLVYATCSINRAENQEVRADFLGRHPEFEPVAALAGQGDEVQLLPHRHGTDGFYIAAMRRRS